MALVLELRPGQALQVGAATIRYEYKSGNVARLHVAAPKEVPVHKCEGENFSQAAPATVPSMRQ
ncbi:hypothetical protein CLI92_09115 [Vandammella animalimorsus]|uniref:Carbon storage regulator n=1 Tax=Vandammella animalimorsus TaxID=2029117 RepID=A0A2A2T4K5_9BURK|nr:hypothetical protein [Vandammella animalimorsus]PAT31871.1 hypothetical protein CK626_07690 [Vandammella animalimorsus]PAX16482.1 hypothetical protein CLI92_09115 [Vandammella animalimorsus]PAX18897.1 hypothetical protein CLI93_11195 [Vandammella animalimorsus]